MQLKETYTKLQYTLYIKLLVVNSGKFAYANLPISQFNLNRCSQRLTVNDNTQQPTLNTQRPITQVPTTYQSQVY